PSAHSPASALATTTTHATTAWTSRSATRGVSPQPWPDEPVATSYDHSSLDTDTGPPWGCGASAPWCPCAKAGLFTQAWKASSSRHRVTTSQVVRPSVGRSSSKPSKPSWSSTAPARAAKRLASSSPEPSGTVMALILITEHISRHLTSVEHQYGEWRSALLLPRFLLLLLDGLLE